jgi:hypothetical protein
MTARRSDRVDYARLGPSAHCLRVNGEHHGDLGRRQQFAEFIALGSQIGAT